MTKIEREIYALIAGADDSWTLAQLSDLYTKAHDASYGVYSRIQWGLLDEHIKTKRGQEGLDHCRREAVRAQ